MGRHGWAGRRRGEAEHRYGGWDGAGRSLAPFMEVFVALRYVGGGAVGTDESPNQAGPDGYVDNWIHLVTISLGLALR